MKNGNRHKRLKQLQGRIEQLEEGSERLSLEIEVHKVSVEWIKAQRTRRLETIRVIGTFIVAVAALWAIYQGIAEYRYSLEQRERETLASALRDFTNTQSAPRRATGMVVLSEFMRTEKIRTLGPGEQLSMAEKIVITMAQQYVEESSPALRPWIIGYLTGLREREMAGALLWLTMSNLGLSHQKQIATSVRNTHETMAQLAVISEGMNKLVSNLSQEVVNDIFQEVRRETGGGSLAISLEGMSLKGYSFNSVDLSGAVFAGSTFSDTDFTDADISGVDMTGVVFDETSMRSLCDTRDWRKARFDAVRRSLLAQQCVAEDDIIRVPLSD